MGIGVPEAHAVMRLIGLPLKDAYHQLVTGGTAAQADEFAALYRRFWLDGSLPLSPLFPGVTDLLNELSDSGAPRLAVATGKSRAGLERELAAHGLAGHFVITRCAGETAPKPEPAMLLEIMAATGSAPQETLMIGDTWLDLLMARNAQVDAVGVLSGGHSRQELESYAPVACLTSVSQLASAFPT